MQRLGAWGATRLERALDRFGPMVIGAWCQWVIGCLRPFFLRRYQRLLPSFLVTRTLWSGAGVIAEDGDLHLSQRAPIIGRAAGLFVNIGRRPILDLRDLHWPPHAALARRKRLHVMVGDANMIDQVNYLKVGITQLVLDLIEAGHEPEGTLLADPGDALARISAGGGKDVVLELADGSHTTALTLQARWLVCAREHFAPALAGKGEAEGERVRDLMRRWEAMLQGLATSPDLLSRDLDWVAKRDLMLESERRASLPGLVTPDRLERLRKIDLRYHEIGPRGYHAQLEATGLVDRLFGSEELVQAMTSAPPGTRAQARSELIRRYGGSDAELDSSWNEVVARGSVELRVGLHDPYESSLPEGLPSAPASGGDHGEPRLERAAAELPILSVGTQHGSSILSGSHLLAGGVLAVGDIALAAMLPSGGLGWLLAGVGYVLAVPLTAAVIVAARRRIRSGLRTSLERILEATINLALVNAGTMAAVHALDALLG
jgi:hypothetical protein